MSTWSERSEGIKKRLKLRTEPIAFRRLQDAGELESIEGVIRWSEGCVFCQIPYMARAAKLTVAVTSDDKLNHRCKRIHGLVPSLEEDVAAECSQLSRTWMPSIIISSVNFSDIPSSIRSSMISSGVLSVRRNRSSVALIFLSLFSSYVSI